MLHLFLVNIFLVPVVKYAEVLVEDVTQRCDAECPDVVALVILGGDVVVGVVRHHFRIQGRKVVVLVDHPIITAD